MTHVSKCAATVPRSIKRLVLELFVFGTFESELNNRLDKYL